MKILMGLLLLSLGLAFGAGFLALQVRQSEAHPFQFSVSEIANLKKKFRDKKRVVNELSSTALFPPQSGFELLDPGTVVNATQGRSFSSLASVYRADKDCLPHLITDSSLAKMKFWIQFRCRKIVQLPLVYFEQPPFMSPFGISFAKLAMNSDFENFKDPKWLERSIPLFHAMELSHLPSYVQLDDKRKILSQLGPEALQKMASGQNWIENNNFTFVRRSSDASGNFQKTAPTADYLVYKKSDWNQFLNQYGVQTLDATASGCAYYDDGLCWAKASTSGLKIQWTMGFLLLLAIAIIIFCVIQIIRNLKSQRLEEERKRFALQALTHELRTPLASLVVSSEHLVDQFETLPGSLKEPFLRMADDVQRLTRVAESSRHYLNAQDSKSVVSFNFTQIPSINQFVADTLDRFLGEVHFDPLLSDRSFHLDKYWVGTCLQNLVQNAQQHGATPIHVQLRMEDRVLVLSVSDAGEISNSDLEKISKPFFKRHGSKGLGLGLAIVETVLSSMNSRLQVLTKPTRFELWIEEPQ